MAYKCVTAYEYEKEREREVERERVELSEVATMRMRAYLLTRNWLLGRLLAARIKSCAAILYEYVTA